MKPAPLDPPARRVLRALYELAELDCPTAAVLLARAVGLRPADVARVLLVLDARGLASAQRARLTLLGLAVAVRQPALGLAQASWPHAASRARLVMLRRCAGERAGRLALPAAAKFAPARQKLRQV